MWLALPSQGFYVRVEIDPLLAVVVVGALWLLSLLVLFIVWAVRAQRGRYPQHSEPDRRLRSGGA